MMVLYNGSGLYGNDFSLDLWLRVAYLERESHSLYGPSTKSIWIGTFERRKEYH